MCAMKDLLYGGEMWRAASLDPSLTFTREPSHCTVALLGRFPAAVFVLILGLKVCGSDQPGVDTNVHSCAIPLYHFVFLDRIIGDFAFHTTPEKIPETGCKDGDADQCCKSIRSRWLSHGRYGCNSYSTSYLARRKLTASAVTSTDVSRLWRLMQFRLELPGSPPKTLSCSFLST